MFIVSGYSLFFPKVKLIQIVRHLDSSVYKCFNVFKLRSGIRNVEVLFFAVSDSGGYNGSYPSHRCLLINKFLVPGGP